ncbi:hypothetical protein ACQKNX_23120 [Lysinibacillus sp. NPDC093712]|uniref:hypothetical protein n=1 Tax=Lysinibacillus sp. NPDC093712 TaxID=3390579 RepID=UPI003CFFB236
MMHEGKQQFEEFVKSGTYSDKKLAEINDKNAKTALEGFLIKSEDKRHVFKELGMVAKFVAKEEREINNEGLINDILAYIRSEALSQVITLNTNKLNDGGVKGLVDEYLYKPTYYVKPTLNSFGKSFNLNIEEDFSNNSVDSLVRFIKFNGEQKERLEADYKAIMNPFLDMKASVLKTEVGSISKIPNKPIWDIYSIERYFGSEFLCEFGEVNLTKLQEWIQIRALPKEVLTAHQVVKNVRLDFVVMSLQNEKKMLDAFYSKLVS